MQTKQMLTLFLSHCLISSLTSHRKFSNKPDCSIYSADCYKWFLSRDHMSFKVMFSLEKSILITVSKQLQKLQVKFLDREV